MSDADVDALVLAVHPDLPPPAVTRADVVLGEDMVTHVAATLALAGQRADPLDGPVGGGLVLGLRLSCGLGLGCVGGLPPGTGSPSGPLPQ